MEPSDDGANEIGVAVDTDVEDVTGVSTTAFVDKEIANEGTIGSNNSAVVFCSVLLAVVDLVAKDVVATTASGIIVTAVVEVEFSVTVVPEIVDKLIGRSEGAVVVEGAAVAEGETVVEGAAIVEGAAVGDAVEGAAVTKGDAIVEGETEAEIEDAVVEEVAFVVVAVGDV